LSDEELVERFRAAASSHDGQQFLNHLFERYHTRVAAWCYRMTGNVDSAADLAQDVFLKAFQRLGSFRGDSKFCTWLYAVARNHCMDELRSRAAKPGEIGDDVLEQVADSNLEPVLQTLVRDESAQTLRELIQDTLDETESKVMTLHYVDELPLDSITRLLGLENPSGAKAYVVSARRKLQRIVSRRRRA
jgi:RNA polymerase sigma-70 factor (ECF subfamily)